MKICPRCNTKYEDKANVCNHDGVRLEKIQEEEQTQQFDAMIGTVLEGRYRILSKLGQGGMGAVYKAEQVRMSRMCAIKVIPEEMAQNGDAIERFDREAKMSALINDPHAVTVYDFGETESGMYFLAMEYVEGETLSSLMRREGVLPLNRVLPLVRQCGEALTAAHRQNIVHRDLKPDNIMVSKKDGQDWVKVLDFGIAKLSADDRRNDLTRQGMVIGTPLYMSPEQLAGDKLDARSDIYSFVLIVYQMLTGCLPFQGDNAQALMVKRLTDDPVPPSVINPQVSIPPGVESAIMVALARDRNNRLPTIQQFVEMFEQGTRSMPVNTGPTMQVNTGPQYYRQQTTNPQVNPYQAGGSGPQGTIRTPNTPGPMPANTPPQPYMQSGPNTPVPYQNPTPQPMPHQTPPQPFPPQQNPYPSHPTPMPFNQPSQPLPTIPVKKSSKAGWIFGIIFILIIIFTGIVIAIFAIASSSSVQTKGNINVNTDDKDNKDYKNGGGGKTVPDKPVNDGASATEHYDRGVAALGQKKYNSAVDEFRAALQSEPNYTEAQENLAFALYRNKEYGDAVTEANRAIEKNGGSKAQSYTLLGRAYYDSSRYNEAAQAFFKSFTLDPTDPEVFALGGFATQLSGNSELANEVYDKFLAAYPQHAMAEAVRQAKAGQWTPPPQLPSE